MPRDGTGAAVSAGSGVAAEVAMDVVRRGGNAVDAAIAGSAAQCVVEMPWCGLGGDAFAMVRTADGDVIAFNGSGAAPAAAWDATADLTKVPRVFVHWPSEMADKHHAAGADVMKAIIAAQLTAIKRGDKPTVGDNALADSTMQGGAFF